jgi:uncharacterized protein (DUF111 family)
MTPEAIGAIFDILFENGALDIYTTPIMMKKNRPAVKLTVLCRNEDAGEFAKIIFSETTSIGVRIREEKRICLPRKAETVKTVYGDLKVKAIEFYGERKLIPEYEDAKKLAEITDVPLYKIYESMC